ncbi:MAG: ATP-binding protein [Thermodesulfobacteriota bacterium]|nr:ATP-binding protein [Thermodesulfobacteriota bacterium]
MKRTQQKIITQDLAKKMVFLTGPRQVGKTYLAQEIAKGFQRSVYLNYDYFEDRDIIKSAGWLPDTELLILDELHKMAGWKNYLKGVYDTRPRNLKIIVTGSARLDTLRRSGDSMAGRFFSHRLNPLSLVETSGDADKNLDRLLSRGGFPEPYLAETVEEANRWRMQYVDGLIRNDILDFEKVHDFKAIQLTLEILRHRVGSSLSFSSLARDINCSPNTIKRYVEIFEALFIIFRVTPYHHNIARSLLKEPKIYFYDTGMVKGDEGVRFENLAAYCLLKHLNAIEDYEGRRAELNYLRTKEKKEVDFALVVEDSPITLVETKLSDSTVSRTLKYFNRKYGFPAVQVIKNLRQERISNSVELRKGVNFLRTLKL